MRPPTVRAKVTDQDVFGRNDRSWARLSAPGVCDAPLSSIRARFGTARAVLPYGTLVLYLPGRENDVGENFMMIRRGASALSALVASVVLVLSTVAAPQAHARAAWEGTSASAMEDYAQRLVANVNKRRANHGLPALRLRTCVDGFSSDWAHWLDTNDKLQHADMGRLMNRCSLAYASENLAGWTGSYAPRGIVDLWMKSDGHRQNILSKRARLVGVTVFYDRSREQFFAVMEFGRHT